MPELWTNNAKSTLASNITSGAGSLTVQSGDGALFPSPSGGDYFWLTLDNGNAIEIVKCTARSTDTLTITRAQQGTSAAAFNSGTKVELRLTANTLEVLQGPLLFEFTPPVDGDFSWVNQGSATVSVMNRALHISAPSNGAAQNARLRAKTLPAAPYTLTVALLPLLHYQQYSIVLFGLRNSSDGKMVLFQIENDASALGFQYVKWTDASTPGVAYIAITNATPMPHPLTYLRIEDNNTNRILYWSADGQNFMQIHSIGRTDHTTPDQAVIGVNPYSQVTGVTLLSWKEA